MVFFFNSWICSQTLPVAADIDLLFTSLQELFDNRTTFFLKNMDSKNSAKNASSIEHKKTRERFVSTSDVSLFALM